jgi:SWI/SNF-related matrix-associated actin-dependent regulator of chromatin subfamily A member 5
MALKEACRYPDWGLRDFQQFMRALEAYGWYVSFYKSQFVINRGESFEVYASDIQDKAPEEVEKYYKTFEKKWSTLPVAGERYGII